MSAESERRDDPDEHLSASDPEFLRARARTYDLLAACLDGDIDALVEAAENGYFVQLSSVFPVDLDPESLAEYDREALEVGYDNLFAVPGPHYVPPFASAHASDSTGAGDDEAGYESDSAYRAGDEGGELLGEPAADLARLYAAADFEPTRGDGIPDHVAAAFEFLGALAAAEAVRREEGDFEAAGALADLQRRTLDGLGWLDEFHERVREADSAEGAFARLVGVARTFAAWDAKAGVAASDASADDWSESSEVDASTDDHRSETSNPDP